MPSFAENFVGPRGDVVYGIDDDRQSYKVQSASTWYFMDQYNNNILPAEAKFRSGKHNEYVKDPEIGDLASNKLKQNKVEPEKANAYFETLKAKDKSPLTLANLAKKYDGKEHPDRDPRYSNMIRKACKFGLDFILGEGRQEHLHFILDKLSEDGYEKVKVKTVEYGYVAYTYSELRYLCRNWNRLSLTGKGRIHFYLKQVEVDAPWKDQDWVLTNTANPNKKPIAQ